MIIPLIHAWGWRPAFAILGIGGMVLSIPLVHFLVPNEPLRYPWQASTDVPEEQNSRHRISYFHNPCFWWAVAGGSLNAFCAFGLLNWLPTYFNRAKGINFEQLGWPLALVFSSGIVGMALMAYIGDKLHRRTQLAGIGFLVAGGMVYLASTTHLVGLVVLLFAIAVFCQSAYGAQEYAIIQHILPAHRVGTGTGLYNGLSVLVGGVGGSFIPGSIVATTGSFDAGILSIVGGAWLASGIMFWLARMIRY